MPKMPAVPAGPLGPAGPCAPVSPAGPAGPCAPVAPAGPVGPCAPVAPVGPELTSVIASVAGWLVAVFFLLSNHLQPPCVPGEGVMMKPSLLEVPFTQSCTACVASPVT